MSETYEEIMRRNEPKNYTVRWRLADGKTEQATYFTSFEEADLYAFDVKIRPFVEDVQILRSGRHPTAKRWMTSSKQRPARITRTSGLVTNEDAWSLPAGYVDGDADKHGPMVLPELQNRPPARSNQEKAEWARNNKFDNRTCLWQ